jgi:hypothetical protein
MKANYGMNVTEGAYNDENASFTIRTLKKGKRSCQPSNGSNCRWENTSMFQALDELWRLAAHMAMQRQIVRDIMNTMWLRLATSKLGWTLRDVQLTNSASLGWWWNKFLQEVRKQLHLHPTVVSAFSLSMRCLISLFCFTFIISNSERLARVANVFFTMLNWERIQIISNPQCKPPFTFL